MTVYTYQAVTTRREHTGDCPVCGKRVKRARTFENTINPFNKNADGTIRTAHEVWVNINRIADQWVPDFTHDACADGAS